jgi:cobyrinic acid a,c-diamide synthase
MGLFDGYDGRSEAGSSAQMAKWLGLPVLLVVNAASMARSAAALVKGFQTFDPDVRFAGVVFNQLGSRRHLDYLIEALADHVSMPCLGGVLRDKAVAIPERHLGLVTGEDHRLRPEDKDRLADLAEESLDLTKLVKALPELHLVNRPAAPVVLSSDGVRIGVARDQAFCFYYQENLDLLVQAGAELVFFSPVAQARLPEDLHGLYFGGGYPELHAQALAANASMRRQVRRAARAGMPVYGECGGFMYLSEAITDGQGRTHDMAGCLPFKTRMLTGRKALGYRQITLTRETLLGNSGRTLRGHEFHYSEISAQSSRCETVYQVADRKGLGKQQEGYQRGNTLGSYLHLHFGSHPGAAEAFIEQCRKFKEKDKLCNPMKSNP